MAITSIKTGSSFTNLVKYNDFLAGNPPFIPSSYESIASATGTGSSDTITFNSIPSTYKHLQIRGILRGTSSAGIGNAGIRINSDTVDANYASHHLGGDGSSVFVYGSASGPVYLPNCFPLADQTANTHGVLIIDIHDYASTTKYKTIRNYCGVDNNNSPGGSPGCVNLGSGLWENTNAITSVSITGLSINFTTSTVFSLYGIKG